MPEKESKIEHKSESSIGKSKKLHEHLKTKVPVPVYIIGLAVLLVLVFFVIRVPYLAKEKYIDIETYEENYKEQIVDNSTPGERVCEKAPALVKITNNVTYVSVFGLNTYYCYAKFRVDNQADTLEEWTYQYVFDVNGKEFSTEPVTEKIDKSPAGEYFEFQLADTCKKGDIISGRPELISGPTTDANCRFVPKMIEVDKTRLAQRNVPKERLVTLSETLFQLLTGANKAAKA